MHTEHNTLYGSLYRVAVTTFALHLAIPAGGRALVGLRERFRDIPIDKRLTDKRVAIARIA